MQRTERRHLDSFAALMLLTGGVLAGLAILVAVNGQGIIRALATSALRGPRRFIDACLFIFSLGPLQPILIAIWLFLLATLLWLAGRLVWEISSRWIHTHRAVSRLRDECLPAIPPALVRQCTGLGLPDRVEVIALPATVAFCHGLRSPRILVSTGLLDRLSAVELEAVLVHERTHLTRRDPLRLLLAQSLAATFHFLSLVPALAQRLVVEQEITADRAVVQAQGGASHLAAALLRLLQDAGADHYSAGLAVSGLSATAVRIEALVDPVTPQELLKLPAGCVRSGITLLTVSAIAGVGLTVAVQAGHVISRCPALSHLMLHGMG